MNKTKGLSFFERICIAGLAIYTFYFVQNLLQLGWFNPGKSTDDALQQVFLFYQAITPGRYTGDLIFTAMRQYLFPLHWGLGYILTLLIGDPIMASHVMQLIQILLMVIFVWLSVRALANRSVAHLAALWLLHTRPLIERTTGGLPRGWLGPVCACFIYLAVTRRFRAILLLFFIASLLNPPSAFLIGIAYGLLLVFLNFERDTKNIARKALLEFTLTGIVVALGMTWLTSRPASIGKMISLQEASHLPQFQRKTGRFKLLPFPPSIEVFSDLGVKAFWPWSGKKKHEAKSKAPVTHRTALITITGLALILLVIGVIRRRAVITVELVIFFIATIIAYALALKFAFYLYLPSRYVLVPLCLFTIIVFSTAMWRALSTSENDKSFNLPREWKGALGFTGLAMALVWFSGWGFLGSAGFSVKRPSPDFYKALNPLLSENALIGGNPEVFGGTMLFLNRRMLATSETTHPFFPTYYKEMQRRLMVLWNGVYSNSMEHFVTSLSKEGVTHFIFNHRDYKYEKGKGPETFLPVGSWVKKLAQRPKESLVYTSLKHGAKRSCIIYHDKRVLVVEVQCLRK